MSNRRGASLALRITLVMACVFSLCLAAYGQSTFGTVLGTVKDPSGSIVPGAKLELVNTGTNAVRTATSGSGGNYQFNNIDVGNYKLRVDAPGFQKSEYQAFDLSARESKHIDIDLQVATQAATVTVEAIATIQTDVSNVSETKGALELTDLPVAIYTRAQGSTSAFSTLTSQPGVQIDDNNSIVVAGALPSQQSLTIDGISSVGPGALQGLAELFPSFNAIEEIKISETLNPAEFGGVADITTISKSGTNNFHGGLFENVQNTEFNAADTFSHIVNPVKMNNFGAFVGGPVIIPHLYNGRNRTFLFGSGEVLRLPKSQTVVLSTPTAAMRGIGTPNGEADLSAYSDPLCQSTKTDSAGNLTCATVYPGNKIPASQLNPFTQKYLDLFYPLPNYGPPGAFVNNYIATYATPINSAQFDVRLDENISPKHLVYVRYTFKNRRVERFPKDNSNNPGSPFPGSTQRPEIYNSMAAAYNWVISPSLVNELRGGFSIIRRGYSSALTNQDSVNLLGLTNLPGPTPPGFGFPSVTLAGFLGAAPQDTRDITPYEYTYQALDTLTWTKAKHTLKFGGDWRYLGAYFTQVFSDYQLGVYSFQGAGTGVQQFLGTGAGVPLASFLLGYPDSTTVASVLNPATDAYSHHYAFFGQDDWKVNSKLTINYGLRWEYHPAFQDKQHDLFNLFPGYTSTVNGQTLHGAIIVADQKSFANLNPQFVQALENTPVILASSVGVPKGLRQNNFADFAPRLGFAYRLNDKTVVRGGYGRFIETLLSASAINGWSVGSSDVATFENSSLVNGKPQFQTPNSYPSNIAVPGTYYFDLASIIKFKDPIVEEWNLTVERDLGKGIGVRASYNGNHSYNVPTLINQNQVRPNTLGINDPSIQAQVPFPQILYTQTASSDGFGNYQAGTVSVHKRSASLQFEASYTYTRNLSNLGGNGTYNGNSFVNEFGAQLSDPFNPGLDYGNTPYDRRNRFLATFFYELPFGKGKAFLNNLNPVVDRLVGGFVLSGVLLFQSGPFLTISTYQDPSGTGYSALGFTGRADVVPGGNPYAGQSINQWINPAAFIDPNNNIGRFGDSQNGAVQGPATKAVSMSLLKRFYITESTRVEIGAQVSNLFNHPNYAPPGNLNTSVPAGFGQITAMQIAEGAGPRQIQLTGRFTF
jgi:hypothetical protein